ncbi:MAG: AAA family ATPase [Firmicutes bacterium]|nr:AAA family ATPase [Bacillota bacterium]
MFLSFAVSGVAGFGLLAFLLAQGRPGGGHRTDLSQPALIVDNGGWEGAPFWDGSGAHAGALLGDVLHDPYQSGGLGTPPHIRVVAGLIHKAHLGVLYVDEIGTLERHTQQQLLTAIQDGEFAITGQSETSAGAMVRTAPVPCRFLLVAAGNKETVAGLHPALRSRIRGYGYEVLLRETMPDSPANRYKLAIFVAQEVGKDGRIPPFHRSGLEEIIGEARRMAGSQGGLTLRLRDLGGLVRAAGDLAAEEGSPLVESRHVLKALAAIRSMERRLSESKTTNQGS